VENSGANKATIDLATSYTLGRIIYVLLTAPIMVIPCSDAYRIIPTRGRRNSMEKSRNLITLFLAICALFVTQALAAEQETGKIPSVQAQTDEKGAITPGQPPTSEKTAMEQADRVSKILGKKVISQKGEDLGKIEDLVLSKDACLDYMVLAPEGLLGTGDRLIPIPWKAVKTGAQADTIIINMDKSQLEQAPNFESKQWPNFTDSEWYGKIREFFGGQK
jgi:sporulation protein YlmC with PRC-barrel domain